MADDIHEPSVDEVEADVPHGRAGSSGAGVGNSRAISRHVRPGVGERDRGASSRVCCSLPPGSADHGSPSASPATPPPPPPFSEHNQHIGQLAAASPPRPPPQTSDWALDRYPGVDHHDTSTEPQDSSEEVLMPSQLIPLLRCPLCVPSTLLRAPTTLQCGHTVCSHHVQGLVGPSSVAPPPPERPDDPDSDDALLVLPACPIPTCASTEAAAAEARLHPNIPATSSVVYRPAPPVIRPDLPPATVPDPKVDVSVAKVLDLVNRASLWAKEEERERLHGFVPTRRPEDGEITSDEDDDEDTPGELTTLQPGPSISATTHPHSTPPSTPPPRPRPLRHRSDSLTSSPSTRPRKRRRKAPSGYSAALTVASGTMRGPTAASAFSDGGTYDANSPLHIRFEKELMGELTCEICFMLLFQPVTSPCQHTFCAKCLHRSLDHSSTCPLCRQELPGFVYFQEHAYNKVILSIILKAFPSIYEERAAVIEAEERDLRLDTPIFICQLSFPGMPTFLHFFEPRYRLMLRRCLESANPRFGMIMPPRAPPAGAPGTVNSGEHGTMLEIRRVEMLPDGRSMVETWGTHRFRIQERGSLDGYMVGRVERIDDYDDELDDISQATHALAIADDRAGDGSHASTSRAGGLAAAASNVLGLGGRRGVRPLPPSNEQLMETCHAFLRQLREGTAPWVVRRLSDTYGPMPTDAASFSFWMALVLPIDEHEKAKLLPIKSPRLRLRLVVHWIEQLNSNWWFSQGCVIL